MIDTVTRDFLNEMVDDLHDLCQPLTALQFRLESARLSTDCQAWKLAVDGGLEETRRISIVVAQIRRHLLREEAVAMANNVHRG